MSIIRLDAARSYSATRSASLKVASEVSGGTVSGTGAGKTVNISRELILPGQEVWLANDEKLAKAHGVRAIHGDAPYMHLEPDWVYEVSLRSTGEVIITPETRLAPSRATP
jgi:hypothetical protein